MVTEAQKKYAASEKGKAKRNEYYKKKREKLKREDPVAYEAWLKTFRVEGMTPEEIARISHRKKMAYRRSKGSAVPKTPKDPKPVRIKEPIKLIEPLAEIVEIPNPIEPLVEIVKIVEPCKIFSYSDLLEEGSES